MNDSPPQEERHAIELPMPTAAPMVCAFGFSLMTAGIVTSWIVAIIGFIIMMVGAVHWFLDSNPESREMPAPAVSTHPTPITPRTGAVEHLMSDASHRARIPTSIHPYSAGLVGGLIGGMAMAAFAVAWGLITQGSLWYSVNLLAGTMLTGFAEMTQDELATFSSAGLIVGIIIQACMSIGVGLLYGVMLPMIPRFQWLFALIIVPLMWSGLTWSAISVVDPALGKHINWLWFVASQLVFGLVTGWWILRTEKINTMQNWHYLERLGIESPGIRNMGDDA